MVILWHDKCFQRGFLRKDGCVFKGFCRGFAVGQNLGVAWPEPGNAMAFLVCQTLHWAEVRGVVCT